MESWNRKLRMGMVGGGQGAFIGWVYCRAAALDQQIDFVSIVTPNDSHFPIAKTFLEAFATIYCGAVEAIRKHIDGNPLNTDDYNFPTVYDGLRECSLFAKPSNPQAKARFG